VEDVNGVVGRECGLPVNVYTNRGKLVVVAPMPGLEPEDIVVTVGGNVVAIHGQLRGELQEGKDYLVHEWRVGPYIRAIQLPFSVDGSRANVTYNNGILTVALPEATVTVAHRIHLERVSAASGEYHGFSGLEAQPVARHNGRRSSQASTSRRVSAK